MALRCFIKRDTHVITFLCSPRVIALIFQKSKHVATESFLYFFPEGDRCEIIMTKESEVVSFKELMQVLRRKIDCLHCIPNDELRIQYKGEDTFVNLRVGEGLNDAFRCAQAVSGTTFRRIKLKVKWQPRSTPQMVSSKRREITERSLTESGAELRKQLLFNVESCNFSASSVTGTGTNKSFLAKMNEPSSSECFLMD